ncbi:AAA family ATPase [Pseudomonas sp. W5-36]|uniref:AAA family ATPase n=1 Tax=Pseudomonas sp. W5-36 TaxID=3097455 RepID=UPI0039786165
MLQILAVENYRSIQRLELSLGRLTVVTGGNGSGKSSLYRTLRLLADTAQRGVVAGIAREGGLESCFWAGPHDQSALGSGGSPARMRLGFAGEDFSYAMTLGMPSPSPGESNQFRETFFAQDPEIKHEIIWAGPVYRPASVLVERKGPSVRIRTDSGWRSLTQELAPFYSLFDTGGAVDSPEIGAVRELIRDWRFYDHFRTDAASPARQPRLGTRTPVLSASGSDLAAALQTIREIGDPQALDLAIDDAFPGSRMEVIREGGLFTLSLHQTGLFRPLTASEFSDGTLRYLLLVAALLTPRPPGLMVLNEPENSLHPDLLPALARLIINACTRSQVWIVSHSEQLVRALREAKELVSFELEKPDGRTQIKGQGGLLDGPLWRWPA